MCIGLYFFVILYYPQLYITERSVHLHCSFLKIGIFQVPEVPKTVVSEEKVSIAVPKRKVAPPEKGIQYLD